MFKYCFDSLYSAGSYAYSAYVGSYDLLASQARAYFESTQLFAARAATVTAATVLAVAAPFAGATTVILAGGVWAFALVPRLLFRIAIGIAAIPFTIGFLLGAAISATREKRAEKADAAVVKEDELVEPEELVSDELLAAMKAAVAGTQTAVAPVLTILGDKAKLSAKKLRKLQRQLREAKPDLN